VTVGEILARTASWLAARGFDAARLEAELLLAHVLGVERLQLYLDRERTLGQVEIDAYRELVRRRGSGEPVAYLTGTREFYGLSFAVRPGVLVPRPETELIVDRARELAPETLLDLGTGSGCIAIACAVRMPGLRAVATDCSPDALDLARANAGTHGVLDRIRFLSGDLYGALDPGERFAVVASNPPYVAEGQAAAVARHEPHAALFAGPDGLDVIRRVVAGAPAHLEPGGTLLCEIGEEQGATVEALVGGAPWTGARLHRDLAGHPRLLEARVTA